MSCNLKSLIHDIDVGACLLLQSITLLGLAGCCYYELVGCCYYEVAGWLLLYEHHGLAITVLCERSFCQVSTVNNY
jgi:hypothetical protein